MSNTTSNLNFNPDLAPPGDVTGLRAEPLATLTEPLPIVKAPVMKYYWNTMPNSSMHRTDGKRLAFVNKFYETDDEEDQKYLDKEIAARNLYVRYATEEEVHANRMRLNPTKTIEDQLRPKIEEEVREKLEQQILERFRNAGVSIPDDLKIKGTDATTQLLESLSGGVKSGTGTIIPSAAVGMQRSVVGSDKLAGNAAGSSSPATPPS